MGIVAERLKIARASKNLSQMDVMRLTQINNKTLSGYENSISEPDYASLLLLANLYGVKTDYLLGRIDSPTDELVKETNEQYSLMVDRASDPATDEINDLLKLMSPEDKEAFRRLAQSVVNRNIKGVS